MITITFLIKKFKRIIHSKYVNPQHPGIWFLGIFTRVCADRGFFNLFDASSIQIMPRLLKYQTFDLPPMPPTRYPTISSELDATAAVRPTASGKPVPDTHESEWSFNFSVDLRYLVPLWPPMTCIVFVLLSMRHPWPYLFLFNLGPSVQALVITLYNQVLSST